MTPLPVAPPAPTSCCGRGHFLPWRSATAGWVAAAAILVLGVPLFLRMPLWVDATLYDVAARTVLAGGVHYRDVFDTNPPGFVWAMCAVRSTLGSSMEAVRAIDLAVVAVVAGLLLRWARAGGATAAGVAWAAAGMAGFYLFISEFNHTQRDTWMTLPALAAASYRHSRVRRAERTVVGDGWVFRTALLEGVAWGVGVWLKPHVVVIAAAAWLVVQGRLVGSAGVGRKWRRAAADLGGALAGGLLVGAAGVAWLVGSGTWPHMIQVFTEWNTSYLSKVMEELDGRWKEEPVYFPPWSVLVVAAVPLAVVNVIRAGLLRPAGDDRRFTRGVLAAVFLAWVGMAVVLQKQFHYAHVPETLLMLALFAANRWAVVVPALLLQFGAMAWLAAEHKLPARLTESAVANYLVWQSPRYEPNRFRWWPGCFAREVPGELRNGVAFQSDHFAGIDWAELEEVAAYLRARGVRDGEVMAFNDTPHALYLALDLRPPIRFMHLSTAADIDADRVADEVRRAVPGVRFVVSDLERWYFPPQRPGTRRDPGDATSLLPPTIRPDERRVFPFDQPTVFRSANGRGRYVVHAVTNPVGAIYTPPK